MGLSAETTRGATGRSPPLVVGQGSFDLLVGADACEVAIGVPGERSATVDRELTATLQVRPAVALDVDADVVADEDHGDVAARDVRFAGAEAQHEAVPLRTAVSLALHVDLGVTGDILDEQDAAVGGLLGDQAWTATALLDAQEVQNRPHDLERARKLIDLMIERLGARGGGFFDTPAEHETLGRLSMRQRPPKENAIAAIALIRFARLTQEPRYEDIARETLEQFANIVESQGYFAADYARAVDMLLHRGAEVKIVASEGDGVGALRGAALALPVPDRIIRVIDASDGAALAAEGLPAQPAPAAYACYGTLCSAPTTTPEDLIETVARTRQVYESTRHAEPLMGPRGERAND